MTQNRYAYVLNNPYKYVDRDGEKVITGVKESWYKLSLKAFEKKIKNLSGSIQRQASAEWNKRRFSSNILTGIGGATSQQKIGNTLNSIKPIKHNGTIVEKFNNMFDYSDNNKTGVNFSNSFRYKPIPCPVEKKSIWDHISDGASKVGNAIANGAKTVVDTVNGALNEVGKALGEAWNWVGDNISNILTGIALVATVIGAAALVAAMLAISGVPLVIAAGVSAAALLTVAVGAAFASTLILIGKQLAGLGSNRLDDFLSVANVVISYGASVASGFISAGKTAKENPEGGSGGPKYPGNNPNSSPGKGFEWRGAGDPSSGKGNWYNPSTGEMYHPDLSHPAPIGPALGLYKR